MKQQRLLLMKQDGLYRMLQLLVQILLFIEDQMIGMMVVAMNLVIIKN